jgi:integrase
VPRGAAIVKYTGRRGIVWRIKWTDASGKQIMETVGAARDGVTERDAEKLLRARLVDVEREGYRRPERVTFGEFADRWQADYLPARNLKPSTVETYESTIEKHLRPVLGAIPLAELEARPELVDKLIAEKTRQGLSSKTIINAVNLLGVMLKQAVRWRLIRTNPVVGAERPRVDQPEMNILTEPEIAQLRAAYVELEEGCSRG